MAKEKHEPFFVKSENVRLDTDYTHWVSDLVGRYRSAQIKAVIKVNSEKLRWNWSLGRDLVERRAEEKWGAGVIKQLSLDLQKSFPGDKGFSSANLWAFKRWYLYFSREESLQKLYQLGKVLLSPDYEGSTRIQNRLSPNAEIHIDDDFPLVLSLVPWRHQLVIIQDCDTIDQAIFYLRETITEGLSRSALINAIKFDLYRTKGNAVTNFAERLPAKQALLAQEITKETYNFGFLKLPEGYNEQQLEEALEKDITRFLLELGNGFAFIGRQKEIVVGGRSRRIDMLFYHIRLRCYVVCELKCVPYEPEFAGKLNYYVNAVDELLKTDEDNPTIGLLICSDKDDTDVRWSFKGIQTPMGVAAYNGLPPENPAKYLPSAEELQQRIALLEASLRSRASHQV